MDIKQYVIDYIEGRISSKDFTKKIYEDASIFEWFDKIILNKKPIYYNKIVVRDDGTFHKELRQYTMRDAVEVRLLDRAIGQVGVHGFISKLVMEAFPQEKIIQSDKLIEQYNFLLDACPEYLLSVDIEDSGILEQLMEEFPETMPKTKRIKAFKEKLKAMFYIEGNKYPRWIQESEWPLSKTGKPTKFLRQKSKGEVSYYYFLDMDTGEEIEIMQAY